MNIGFIGLGVMGFPMAGHLHKSKHNVAVFNRSLNKVEKWIKDYEGKAFKNIEDIAQFYVESSSQDSQVTMMPKLGPDRPAMFIVDGREMKDNLLRSILILSNYDRRALSSGGGSSYGFKFPRMANHYFNATFIANESEIFYDAEIRKSGSPFTRDGGASLAHGKWKLPGDRLFRERNLFGTGLRMIIDDQMRFGAGAIYEEETDLDNFTLNTTRLSAYFHDNFEVAENVNFNTTIYYQPGVIDFSDYKASFLMAFNFLVNEKFSISLQYDIAYDSDPITNAVEDDQGLSTKFSYSFN